MDYALPPTLHFLNAPLITLELTLLVPLHTHSGIKAITSFRGSRVESGSRRDAVGRERDEAATCIAFPFARISAASLSTPGVPFELEEETSSNIEWAAAMALATPWRIRSSTTTMFRVKRRPSLATFATILREVTCARRRHFQFAARRLLLDGPAVLAFLGNFFRSVILLWDPLQLSLATGRLSRTRRRSTERISCSSTSSRNRGDEDDLDDAGRLFSIWLTALDISSWAAFAAASTLVGIVAVVSG